MRFFPALFLMVSSLAALSACGGDATTGSGGNGGGSGGAGGGDGGSAPCKTDADCPATGVTCMVNACTVGGSCKAVVAPVDATCDASGIGRCDVAGACQKPAASCDVGKGSPDLCDFPADCDDGNSCTNDDCVKGGDGKAHCVHDGVEDNASCGNGGHCQLGACCPIEGLVCMPGAADCADKPALAHCTFKSDGYDMAGQCMAGGCCAIPSTSPCVTEADCLPHANDCTRVQCTGGKCVPPPPKGSGDPCLSGVGICVSECAGCLACKVIGEQCDAASPTLLCATGCDDNNPCTDDSCVGAYCHHVPVGNGTACGNEKACLNGACCAPPK